MGFAQDVTTFAQKTGLNTSLVMRKAGLDAYAGVLKRSPVRTGRFRASNRISLNVPDLSVAPETSTIVGNAPFAGGPQLNQAVSILGPADGGDTIFITNALPYAKKLEDGGSAQTNRQPDGIYGATIQELRASFAQVLRRILR